MKTRQSGRLREERLHQDQGWAWAVQEEEVGISLRPVCVFPPMSTVLISSRDRVSLQQITQQKQCREGGLIGLLVSEGFLRYDRADVMEQPSMGCKSVGRSCSHQRGPGSGDWLEPSKVWPLTCFHQPGHSTQGSTAFETALWSLSDSNHDTIP